MTTLSTPRRRKSKSATRIERAMRRNGVSANHIRRDLPVRRATKNYAIVDRDGEPIRCRPGIKELSGEVAPARPGNNGKVCYGSEKNAERALRQMSTSTSFIEDDFVIYQCERIGGTAPDGHYHVASRRY